MSPNKDPWRHWAGSRSMPRGGLPCTALRYCHTPHYQVWPNQNFQKEQEWSPKLVSRQLWEQRAEQGTLAIQLAVYGPEKALCSPALPSSDLISLYLFIYLTMICFHSKMFKMPQFPQNFTLPRNKIILLYPFPIPFLEYNCLLEFSYRGQSST